MIFSVRFEDGKETKSKEIVTKYLPPNGQNNTAIWEYRFGGFLNGINMIRALRIQTLKTLYNGLILY